MNEPLMLETIGLMLSSAAWLVGVTLNLRIERVVITRLPDSWRLHPELREGFQLKIELRTPDVLRARTSLLRWLGTLTAFASALAFLDIPLWGPLLVAVAYSTYSTASEVTQAQNAQRKSREMLRLPELEADRRLEAQSAGSLMLLKTGFFFAPVFFGYLLLELLP